jgi:glucose/arabinose dehydrogenase
MTSRSLFPFGLLGVLGIACSPSPTHDAGRPDAGDAGDSGPVDAGDSGLADAGDAGPVDAGDSGPADAGDAGPVDSGFDAGGRSGCELPGSWIHDATGVHVVPGGLDSTDLSWLTLPQGFCAHHYAVVPNARQLRFAPGGELFVASPVLRTTGGARNGMSAIVVIPDDDADGLGDSILTFKDSLPATQGLLFTGGYLYYQDDKKIMREAYNSGQRADTGSSELVVDITLYHSRLHWPKTLDVSDTGHIYVGNGGDQGEVCAQPMPFHGGVLEIDGTPGGDPIVSGLRNPIDVKCHRDGKDHCFATELSLDFSASQGGREKLIPIHPGDNWGYPCCATAYFPYSGVMIPCPQNPSNLCPPDCSTIVAETNSFIIGNTPFGFDFEDKQFPPPWDHRVLVALHGETGTWAGERIVAIATDPVTGLPLPSSNTDGGNNGNLSDFATGWDDGTQSHGRPSDIVFSPDGRMFVANDNSGEILWIAALDAGQ